MANEPTAQRTGAASPPRGPLDDKATSPATDKRSKRKKIVTPLILAFLGLALLAAAFLLYPSQNGRPSPAFPTVAISSDQALGIIDYRVVQVRPGVAEIKISLEAFGRVPSTFTAAAVSVALPAGTAFADCSKPACNGQLWSVAGVFTPGHRVVHADIFVKAPSFGVTYNGVTAAAAIPDIFLSGRFPGPPTLYTSYQIPSASSYDWSSYPPYSVSSST